MTSAAELLPRVPAPPHDPYSIVLDARVGWSMSSVSTNVEVSPVDSTIALGSPPGGARPLADAAGTFGGNALPANVALAPENACGPAFGAGGVVLLLNKEKSVLERFDPCSCEFVVVPCIAGEGSGARQVKSPGGMTTTCGNLYVCDTGNRRVSVFTLRGLVLRALWTTPAAAKLATEWTPMAIAADERGHVYVGDPANGCVHVFRANGRWIRKLDGLGAVEHLAVDRQGRLYVQIEASDEVRVLDPWKWPHAPIETLTRADEVHGRFAALPFAVTPEGDLALAPLCADPPSDTQFDASGNAVKSAVSPYPLYSPSGTYVSQVLDSALHRCVWDRLRIRGAFPAQTTVRAFVYTSDAPLPDALVGELTDDMWSECPILQGGDDVGDEWDCLLRAPAGRYAWLKLTLEGDAHVTPRLKEIQVVFPRVSLRRHLPAAFGADALAAEFTDRFLGVFDQGFRSVERTIDWQAHFFDPLSAPAGEGNRKKDFLSWLASWIGVTLDRSWPIARRRRYLKNVGKLFPLRGTLRGLERHLQLFLGIPQNADDCLPLPKCGPCTTKRSPRWQPPRLVLEHFRLRRWMFLGKGRLGDEARLWGQSIVRRSQLSGPDVEGNARVGATRLDTVPDPLRDPLLVYAHRFTVFAPASAARTEAAKRSLERLVRAERPAHTAYQVVYVEPRFRIGIQSMIGFDSAIGRYPDGGIKLEESRLGKATVIGGDGPRGPMSIGADARVGTTTRLG